MNRLLSGVFLLTSAFFLSNSWAVPAWSPVMTLSVGNEWADAGETQRFYLQPDVEKNYVANRKTDTLLGAELFIGAEHRLTDSLTGQIGLAIAKSAHTSLHGDIWEDADPDFNNYSYAYKINHSHIAIKGVLLTSMQYGLLPY
ncbi:MAG: porin family protein, partial [Gammaproteobacteria bacterium]